jgi:hypothetical protein
MTSTPADFPRSSPLRAALHRFAGRLRRAARAEPRAPVPHGGDARGLAQISDHLLRDIGFVREPAACAHSSFAYI